MKEHIKDIDGKSISVHWFSPGEAREINGTETLIWINKTSHKDGEPKLRAYHICGEE